MAARSLAVGRALDSGQREWDLDTQGLMLLDLASAPALPVPLAMIDTMAMILKCFVISVWAGVNFLRNLMISSHC